MSAPQRLSALMIPGLWGLSMGSVHDIHYKARLRKSQRLVSNLSAAKETPAALNSMCGAKGTALRLQPAWNDEELCSEAIPTLAFIPGDVIDPQAGFRGNAQLPFPQLTACTMCLRHCSGASLLPRHLSHQLAPGKAMETFSASGIVHNVGNVRCADGIRSEQGLLRPRLGWLLPTEPPCAAAVLWL